MIATALLVTPLASLAPVGGNSVVEASTLSERIGALESFYDGLVAEEAVINHHRDLIPALAGEWDVIVGPALYLKINQNLTSSIYDTDRLIGELSAVFLHPNYSDVETAALSFAAGDSGSAFETAFGITFFEFAVFYADLLDIIKANYNQSTIEAAIGSSLTDFMVAEAKKVSNYSTLSVKVKGKIGSEYDVASLIGIKFNMMTALDGESNYAPGTLKNTLIAAVKQNLNTAPSDGGTPAPTPEPTPDLDASDSTTKTTETATDGSTTVVSTVDLTQLTGLVQDAASVDKVTLTVENAAGEAAEVRLPAKAFDVVYAKNPNAKVEIESTEGTIRVPAKEINVSDIAQSLGVNADDVSINVSIKTSTVVVKNEDGSTSKSKVVEFKITATAGNNSMDLNRYNSYIERDITADDDLNADRTVVVLLDEDGNIVKSVPTQITGKKATFKNMSNSLYTIIENDVTFPDITTNWAKATIDKLASKMIIQGMDTGKFEPAKAATRAEFAALLTRSLGLNNDVNYDNRFADVKGSEWFVADMMAAVEAGIIEGHDDGSFKGNDPVTREQAAAMIARAIELTGVTIDLDETKGLTDFADEANVSTWAVSSVEQLIQAAIITGRPNAQIAPQGDSQRAEIAVMLERFLKTVNFMN